jgi:hypothetical protein
MVRITFSGLIASSMVSPEVLRRERDYDAGCDNQYDHLRPKAIGKATWLPVFLHSHGISPLEDFPDGDFAVTAISQ